MNKYLRGGMGALLAAASLISAVPPTPHNNCGG